MTNLDKSAKRIGRNITNLLIENEKSQQELADAIGVSKSTVSTWANGKRIPRMDKVDKMCQFFGVPRSAILGDTDGVTRFVDESTKKLSQLPMWQKSEEDFKKKVLEIVNESKDNSEQEYYDDEVVQIITDRLRTNPEYGLLFKAAADLKPEDIELVQKFIERMSD